MIILLMSMGVLLSVFILPTDFATGVICADFLIHSKQQNQLANSFSLCRYLPFALVLENVVFGSLTIYVVNFHWGKLKHISIPITLTCHPDLKGDYSHHTVW